MGKKVREYQAGDFIFAKVKGYPAWPARVHKPNGKKYLVYFYGTGETANLSPNMIFDYAENKDKFLTKTVKRRDFNDGVKQIEHDFANNVPLEQVIGIGAEVPPAESSTLEANDSVANDTLDETAMDTTAADETMAEEPTLNTTQNDAAVEDSDDTGNLVIDEGKQKQQPKKVKPETKAKETPVKPVKEPKTPRGKGKKEEPAKDDDEEKKEEEIVSRSGRKIRPKRYIDEQTEDNATLPSPAPKKRRGASPAPTPDKEKEKAEPKEKVPDKNIKQFNAVTQSELEDLKEPFKSEDAEKENILIAYLPSGRYVGIKLFQSRPSSFKNEASRLQWDKQAATNAVTLKMQLEKGHISYNSVVAQLVTDLNLTDEEKATLDKERETEEKKSRVQFLKTEMKMIELDAKIKTCLSLEKADTDMCLKLLDDLLALDIKPLMLLKHPTCLETIKRMRAYVGNTPSWELSESAALVFTKQAHKIRKQADAVYKKMRDLFTPLEGLSFWEYFTNRVMRFKKATGNLSADELLELIHEPFIMSEASSLDMKEAVDTANETEQKELLQPDGEDKNKKKTTPAKAKKSSSANNISKTPVKRQSSRKLQDEKEKEKEKEKDSETTEAEPTTTVTEATEATTTAEEQEDTTKPQEDTQKLEEREKTPEKTAEVVESEKEKELTEENGDLGNGEKVEEEFEKEKAKEKEEVGEPRAKRSRENKKTEPPPPRSPAKRKSKV